ncbi:MAG: hypothetical protein M1594_00115 [Candidatus Marsarchaeota archaeon]|nr:hypothetical protein [Candidatus Marsarchaeota archaeon]
MKKIIYVLVGAVGLLLILNGYFMFEVLNPVHSNYSAYQSNPQASGVQGSAVSNQPVQSSQISLSLAGGISSLENDSGFIKIKNYSSVTEIQGKIMISGTPDYGSKLGVSFNDPSSAVNVLSQLDNGIPTNSLSQDQLQRYISIGTNIACFYCCGATTLVDNNGNPACSCNHSMALRGLAKWMILNTNYTNGQILLELNKWKALFFPGPTINTASALAQVDNGSVEVGWLGTPSNIPQSLIQAMKNPGSGSGLPAQIGGCG